MSSQHPSGSLNWSKLNCKIRLGEPQICLFLWMDNSLPRRGSGTLWSNFPPPNPLQLHFNPQKRAGTTLCWMFPSFQGNVLIPTPRLTFKLINLWIYQANTSIPASSSSVFPSLDISHTFFSAQPFPCTVWILVITQNHVLLGEISPQKHAGGTWAGCFSPPTPKIKKNSQLSFIRMVLWGWYCLSWASSTAVMDKTTVARLQ